MDATALPATPETTPHATAAGPLPEVLTASEAARLLRIHVRSLYRLVATGHVPHQRLRRRLRFQRRELEAWLSSNAAAASPPDPPDRPRSA